MPRELTISTADGDMGLLRADPDGDRRGGIVVVQEAFGLTKHIGSICDRLAADGWLAVAPAIYHRPGSPVLGYDDLAAVGPHFSAISPDGLRVDLEATLGMLREAGLDAPSTGIVGFCMGGSITLWAATELDLGAAVTFYGGG